MIIIDIIEIVDDDGKLRQRYNNKCVNAKKEGLLCKLTFDEYCQLVYDAGLFSSQLGYKGEGYVLARFNDCGDYDVSNCRFVTHKENVSERRVSEKSRMASRQNVKIAQQANSELTSHELSLRIRESCKWQEYNNRRKELSQKRKLERMNRMDRSRSGKNNSQYGTFWITNDSENKKWRYEYGSIPTGWHKGRVINL